MKTTYGKLLLFVCLLFIFFSNTCYGYSIGLITDIHGGGKKKRVSGEGSTLNIVYPRKYKTCFISALKQLKAQGINTVVVTGDMNTDKKIKYSKKLVHLAKKNKMDVIWAKGNHDNERQWRQFSERAYYYVDRGVNTRIVVLNSTVIDPKANGGLDGVQLNWLEGLLNSSENKNVVIAMHHPVFYRYTTTTNPAFASFLNLIKDRDNVKYVVGGHWHREWEKELDGVTHVGTAALCAGKLNYRIINVPDTPPTE